MQLQEKFNMSADCYGIRGVELNDFFKKSKF